MTQQIECPADGCDYTGLPDSVKGHYTATTDGDHTGGWQRCKARIEADTDAPPDESPADVGGFDTRPDPDPATSTDDSPADSPAASNPAFDGPPSKQSMSDNTIELPCGHEEIEEPSEPGIATCDTCGGQWRYDPDE